MKIRQSTAPVPSPQLSAVERREHIKTVARVAAISIIVSEVITFVLIRILLGQILIEGQIIALVCAGPISAWIADRQLRLRRMIADQRDRLAAVNIELNARNADLDAFARGVAHDLKNPLAAVIGLAYILDADPNVKVADHEKAVPTILESGERAVEIIDSLLLLHGIRQQDPQLSRVDSEEVVQRALRTLSKPMADREAVVTLSGKFPTVYAHGPWLLAVLENLIGNAVKYGGSPPSVNLSSHQAADGKVRFEVRDYGAGIPIEARHRIFDEYERVNAQGEDGHGLGLAIVRRIVNRLGGEAGYDSPADGGALFWFTVPAV